MSRESSKNVDRLVIGGPPRANLLPPEVGVAAEGRAMRRNAIALIVVAMLVVIVAYGGATVLTLGAESKLAASSERTQVLLKEQSKYIEVRQVTLMLNAAEAAKRVGTSTEVDWKSYLDDIQASLPAGTLVTHFQAETSTPLMDFGQPNVPLQGDRMGELNFTATSRALPDVESWLIALADLPGFVDAAPGTITLNENDGFYVVSIAMHIDKDALLLRYDEKAKEAQTKAREDKAAKKEAAAAEVEESKTQGPSDPATDPDADADADTDSDADTEDGQ